MVGCADVLRKDLPAPPTDEVAQFSMSVQHAVVVYIFVIKPLHNEEVVL
jgi:hypothetical protein